MVILKQATPAIIINYCGQLVAEMQGGRRGGGGRKRETGRGRGKMRRGRRSGQVQGDVPQGRMP